MNALALCLHLAALPSHPVKDCAAKEGPIDTATFTTAIDGHAASMTRFDEKGYGTLVKMMATQPPSGAVIYTNPSTRMALMLHTPNPWLKTWLDDFSEVMRATYTARALEADIAREKANPAGVVDLKVLHDDGESLQIERDSAVQGAHDRRLSSRRHERLTPRKPAGFSQRRDYLFAFA